MNRSIAPIRKTTQESKASTINLSGRVDGWNRGRTERAGFGRR